MPFVSIMRTEKSESLLRDFLLVRLAYLGCVALLVVYLVANFEVKKRPGGLEVRFHAFILRRKIAIDHNSGPH